MAIKKYYDSDCNLGVLDGKTVAVIGFGSQGHAHSENLAESGVNVVVGLRKGSPLLGKGLSSLPPTRTQGRGSGRSCWRRRWVMMLVPDELCADIYNKQVAPYMTGGQGSGLCTRLQHPLQDHHCSQERGRYHDRSQGPRPHRPPPVHRGRGLPLSDLRGAGPHRQG